MFVLAKDRYDGTNKHFSYKKYAKTNWDNTLLSLILVPVIAYYAADIWGAVTDWIEKDYIFRKVYYIGVGAVVELLYWLANKFGRK